MCNCAAHACTSLSLFSPLRSPLSTLHSPLANGPPFSLGNSPHSEKVWPRKRKKAEPPCGSRSGSPNPLVNNHIQKRHHAPKKTTHSKAALQFSPGKSVHSQVDCRFGTPFSFSFHFFILSFFFIIFLFVLLLFLFFLFSFFFFFFSFFFFFFFLFSFFFFLFSFFLFRPSLAALIIITVVASWLPVCSHLDVSDDQVVCGGWRLGQVIPSQQNRQMSVLAL